VVKVEIVDVTLKPKHLCSKAGDKDPANYEPSLKIILRETFNDKDLITIEKKDLNPDNKLHFRIID
jgi:hypothetical protein